VCRSAWPDAADAQRVERVSEAARDVLGADVGARVKAALDPQAGDGAARQRHGEHLGDPWMERHDPLAAALADYTQARVVGADAHVLDPQGGDSQARKPAP
jgi:hypothetical protein